jgi:hypothetical protein
LLSSIGSIDHRAVAQEAVPKFLALLKNQGQFFQFPRIIFFFILAALRLTISVSSLVAGR